MIRVLTDEEARRAMPEKWGAVDPDVIPACVAETDFALAPEITEALHDAIDSGTVGYPAFGWGGELGEAYAGFAQRQYAHSVEPGTVCPVVDVTAGARLALDVFEPGPMVMPGAGVLTPAGDRRGHRAAEGRPGGGRRRRAG